MFTCKRQVTDVTFQVLISCKTSNTLSYMFNSYIRNLTADTGSDMVVTGDYIATKGLVFVSI